MESILNTTADLLFTHSWQIALVFAVVATLCAGGRRASAHWRYLLWTIVLVKCVVPPVLTLPLAVLPAPARPTVEAAASDPATTVERTIASVSAGPPPEMAPGVSPIEPIAAVSIADIHNRPVSKADPAGSGRMNVLAWVPVVWIAGACLFALLAIGRATALHRRIKRTRRPTDPSLQRAVAEAASRLGMAAAPRVWQIDWTSQPFVWGWWRGDVYLPTTFGQMPRAQSRSILLHELAHVVRRDAAVNLLQMIVQALLFFHPLVWWANRQLRQEREKCCDEIAVAVPSERPAELGRAIVNTLIVEHQTEHPLPSLAIAGPAKNIEERIRTMMHRKTFHRRPSMLAAATVLAMAVLLVPTALTLTARAVADRHEQEVHGRIQS